MREGLRYVHLTQGARERGRAHGEQLRETIARGLEAWKTTLHQGTGESPETYLDSFVAATNYLPAIERWTPHLLEEVRGIAEGASISFRDAYAYQLIDEEWTYRFEQRRAAGEQPAHCSVIGTDGHDDVRLLAQNMDLPCYYDGTQTLLRIDDPESGLESLVFTPAGII